MELSPLTSFKNHRAGNFSFLIVSWKSLGVRYSILLLNAKLYLNFNSVKIDVISTPINPGILIEAFFIPAE